MLKKATAVRALPPHHVEATTPREAYRLDEIIPDSCTGALDVGRLLGASESDDAMKKLGAAGTVSARDGRGG